MPSRAPVGARSRAVERVEAHVSTYVAKGGLVTATALIFAACASGGSATSGSETPQAVAGPATVQEGERILALGDPAGAIEVLEQIPEADPTHVYAQELIGVAREELEAVVDELFAEIDQLIDEGLLISANQRCDYVAKRFGHLDDIDDLVAERTARIKVKLPEVRERLKLWEEDARAYLVRNDLAGATRVLRSAHPVAWDLEPDRAMRWVQMIAVADIRGDEPAVAEGSNGNTRRRRRRVSRRRRTPQPVEQPPPKPGEGVEEARAELDALLAQAAEFRRKKDFFQSIVTYMKVRRRDQSNTTATKALEQLDSKRQQLIRKYLDLANTYFLRQDLAQAEPHFRRVLSLDPSNQRAREGLQMKQNLDRIRNEAKGKGKSKSR